MNYERIYNELIEHRKVLPKLETEYYERHHIIPKCVGGNDDEENLIYLTTEDHYIAHLLLAKAFGGIHWAGAHIMSTTSKSKNRRSYSIIRNAYLAYVRNNTIYTLKSLRNNKEIQGTKKQLIEVMGISEIKLNHLLNGKCASANGYSLPTTTDPLREALYKEYTFIFDETGESFNLSRKELFEIYNVPLANSADLVQGIINSCHGYRLETPLKPAQRRLIREFRNIWTGEIVRGSSRFMQKNFNMDRSKFSGLVRGDFLFSGNFCLNSTPQELLPHTHIFSIQNLETGEVITGTKLQIREKTGLDPSELSSLLHKRAKIRRGFKLVTSVSHLS